MISETYTYTLPTLVENPAAHCNPIQRSSYMMLSDQKLGPHVEVENPPDLAITPDTSSHNSLRDEALDFLEEYKNAAAVTLSRNAAFTRALRKKIDFRIATVLWLAYTLCFIDKVLLNVRDNTPNTLRRVQWIQVSTNINTST